jgi:hypothetical protein
MDHSLSTFGCGCAPFWDFIICGKSADEVSEAGQENCTFLVCDEGKWMKYEFAGAWTAIAMATIKPQDGIRTVVAISPGGAYFEAEPKSLKESHGQIKTATGSLRALSAIDDVIYACGMGRSVLKRKKLDSWDEIGPGMTKKDDGKVVGFEDIDGFGKDDMYAVGWMGEIWNCKKGKWKQCKSPVTTNLNAVCCAADGNVYIAGDDGTFLYGKNDDWTVADTKGMGNIMDTAFYNGTAYAVTDFQIFKLKDNKLIAEDAFAKKGDMPATCLFLLTAENGLVSMGTKDLFLLKEKETKWKRVA